VVNTADKMNLSCRRTPSLVSLVAIAILVLFSDEPATKSNALGLKVRKTVDRVASKIPEKWKKDPTTGRPRACGVIEKTVGLATRVVLLGGGGGGVTADDAVKATQVTVDADSNRSALGGNLKELTVAVRDSRSPLGLLEVESLDVEGSDLKLGLSPLLTTAGVPAMLLLPPVRSTVWTLSIYYYLWTVAKRLAKRNAASGNDASTAKNIEARMEATEALVGEWKKRILGGSPSNLSLEMVLSNENLANSLLLRQSSKFLLQFLMKNSVLQTAAIVGDAVSDSASQTPVSKPPRRNSQLPEASGTLARANPQQPQSPFDPAKESPKKKLSRLLSATAFELREAPTFRPEDGKNHLQFVSVAILPGDQARLEFVLRTTLEAGRNRDCLMRLVQPECRFDVTEATSSLPLPKVFSELLPKVLWLPIGAGVSIGEGTDNKGGLSIRNVKVSPEGKCILGADIFLLPEPSKGGLVRLFE